jgi:hypothetical protein
MFADTSVSQLWLALHGFLLIQRRNPPGWGKHDCNLLVVDWIDQLNHSNEASRIRGQYCDMISAVRFQKNFTPATEWLQEQGFAEADVPQEGDIVLVETAGYWQAHIYHAEQIWSVDMKYGLINGPLSSLAQAKGKHTIWRKL